MRIVFLSEYYSEGMGYIENCLPKALTALGHEVHVVASEFQVYGMEPQYTDVYEPFLGPAQQPLGSFSVDGYTIHRLRHKSIPGFMGIMGLAKLLANLQPQIVEATGPISGMAFQANAMAYKTGYKLFTRCHTTLYLALPRLPVAVLPKWRFRHARRLCYHYGTKFACRLAHRSVEKCFAATEDCAVVAHRFFGVPESKIRVLPLGSDTDVFRPVRDARDLERRLILRRELGCSDGEILCIYTGRFTGQKIPVVLARAIEILRRRGLPYAGLFIGNGPQGEEIRRYPACTVMPFMKHLRLADYYQAADIGVWPAHDSMSMLDAGACGLPIVASEKLAAVERYEGNGLTYREPDPENLACVLANLRQEGVRRSLGDIGAQKVRERFSWLANAQARLEYYREACGAAA